MKLIKIIFLITILFSHGDDHEHDDHLNPNYHSIKNGTISGFILEENTNEAIQGASISVLVSNQEKPIDGTVSDDDGFFSIDLPIGRYELLVQFIGYESVSIPIELIKRNQKLGKIKLNRDSILLEAIEVIDEKEERPIVEFETDKMIYNASEDIITGNGTAEDVLRKVPMVTVDQDGDISLRGNPNVTLKVDGKPMRSQISDISASTIEKVEVITSPSAKYDPEGMAGIINIVRKKGNNDGFNGSVRLNGRNSKYYGPDKMNGLTFYSNYRKNKFNFYSSFSANNKSNQSTGHRYVTTNYYNENSDEISFSESLNFNYENLNDRYSKRLQLGLDYYFSDELILNWEFGLDSNLKDQSGATIFTQPIPFTYNTTEIDDNDNYDSEGTFELIKTFTDYPGREISFSFSHHNHDDYETESFDDGNTTESSNLNNKNGTYEMSLNYKYPINENINLEFGYDGDYVESDQSLDFEIDALKGINDFNYNRGIHALYLEYENKLSDKFSIKPSLRYERVSKEVSSIINLDNNQDSYNGDNVFAQFIQYSHDNPQGAINLDNGALYPNLNFTYNIIKPAPKVDENEMSENEGYQKYAKYGGSRDKVYSLQFGLSKRVERPGSFGHGRGVMQIRPFPRDIYSSGFLFIGNPYLKPEYSTQYDISFKGPGPAGFFSTSLFYHEIQDKIEWYDDDSYENLDVLTFKNSDNGYEAGLSYFMVLAGQVIGGTYSKTRLNDDSGDYELNEESTFMNTYFRMSLPEQMLSQYIKWWNFDFEYGFYWMKIETPTGSLFGDDGTLWANLSFSKAFLNDNLRISLSVDNLYDNPGFQMLRTKPLDITESSEGVNYDSAYETTDTYNERGGRTISLSFRYNFGDSKDERNKKRMKKLDGGQRGGGQMDMGY
mgnify:FL=1